MSKINVNTWEPESGTAATLMASGDTVTLPDGAILAVASGGDINVASGGEIDIASGATLDVNGTIDLTGATKTGFPTGGLLGIVIYTGNGTYTPGNTDNGTAGDEGNASVTKVIVEVQAAGGGSGAGGGTGTGLYGAAGGGGSYARQFISTLTTATVVVGANGGASSTGGTSSWTDTSNTISCLGGVGGTQTVGGLGGVATAAGAFMKIDGQPGTPGRSNGFPRGGDSFLGIGGIQSLVPTTIAGKAASGYGGGGACGYLVTSLSANGTSGIVIIAEYA